jgi:hypothetical protein
MPFPVKRWRAPVCMLALAAPFAGSGAAYHAADRLTGALMSAAADIKVFERKTSDARVKPPMQPVRLAQSGEDWLDALRNGSYWKRARDSSSSRSARREKSSRQDRKAARSPSTRYSSSSIQGGSKVVIAAHTGSLPRRGNGEAYRTVCVRLCDGYYWPIGFATSSSELMRDSAKCEQGCSTPAKLYYAPMLGEAPELIDLNGQPYTKLGTAFQYRASYNANCKCRAHPWEMEAQARHQAYAASEPASVREERARQAATELKEISATASPEKPPED